MRRRGIVRAGTGPRTGCRGPLGGRQGVVDLGGLRVRLGGHRRDDRRGRSAASRFAADRFLADDPSGRRPARRADRFLAGECRAAQLGSPTGKCHAVSDGAAAQPGIAAKPGADRDSGHGTRRDHDGVRKAHPDLPHPGFANAGRAAHRRHGRRSRGDRRAAHGGDGGVCRGHDECRERSAQCRGFDGGAAKTGGGRAAAGRIARRTRCGPSAAGPETGRCLGRPTRSATGARGSRPDSAVRIAECPASQDRRRRGDTR